jgi:hypothetical protein
MMFYILTQADHIQLGQVLHKLIRIGYGAKEHFLEFQSQCPNISVSSSGVVTTNGSQCP